MRAPPGEPQTADLLGRLPGGSPPPPPGRAVAERDGELRRLLEAALRLVDGGRG